MVFKFSWNGWIDIYHILYLRSLIILSACCMLFAWEHQKFAFTNEESTGNSKEYGPELLHSVYTSLLVILWLMRQIVLVVRLLWLELNVWLWISEQVHVKLRIFHCFDNSCSLKLEGYDFGHAFGSNNSMLGVTGWTEEQDTNQ